MFSRIPEDNIFDLVKEMTSTSEYFGIDQFVQQTTKRYESGSKKMEPGTFTSDKDFEEMLLRKSDLHKLVRSKSRKSATKIDYEVRKVFLKMVLLLLILFNIYGLFKM